MSFMTVSPQVAYIGRVFTEAVFNPFFAGFVLIMMMLIYLFFREKKIIIRLGVVIVFIGLIAVTTPWLPGWMLNYLERQYQQVQIIDPNVQIIVVLGGGVSEVDAPAIEALNRSSIKRVLEGIRLFKLLPDATLILSGGGSKNANQSVGARMAELITWLNLNKQDHILVELDSINTLDEAKYLKSILKQKPFYLVTSARHMPRSMRIFEHQGMHPIAAPCDYSYFWEDINHGRIYIPNLNNLAYVCGTWHELLGIFWGKIRGFL
jgi:uncharacterized SAM-binding protein YcdF (DUF218 family)